MDYKQIVERVRQGADAAKLIESEMQSASGNTFQDRSDDLDSPQRAAAEFERIAREIQGSLPNVGPDWIASIADQVKLASPEGLGELKRLVYDNREQYAGSARIDAGGSYRTWDAALQGITAIMTDQVPPPAPGAVNAPGLA